MCFLSEPEVLSIVRNFANSVRCWVAVLPYSSLGFSELCQTQALFAVLLLLDPLVSLSIRCAF